MTYFTLLLVAPLLLWYKNFLSTNRTECEKGNQKKVKGWLKLTGKSHRRNKWWWKDLFHTSGIFSIDCNLECITFPITSKSYRFCIQSQLCFLQAEGADWDIIRTKQESSSSTFGKCQNPLFIWILRCEYAVQHWGRAVWGKRDWLIDTWWKFKEHGAFSIAKSLSVNNSYHLARGSLHSL